MNKPDWPFDTGIPEIPDDRRTKPPEMKTPKVNLATIEQPIPHGEIEIAPLVQKDIEERAKVGCKKYGELLKSNNGRNALWDAYQEALDLCMYLRQKIEEEK